MDSFLTPLEQILKKLCCRNELPHIVRSIASFFGLKAKPLFDKSTLIGFTLFLGNKSIACFRYDHDPLENLKNLKIIFLRFLPEWRDVFEPQMKELEQRLKNKKRNK